MFTTHFKLSAQPFVERMPVDRLLQDERMTQGLARLEYLATAGSIALIAGQTGVGKSSLLNDDRVARERARDSRGELLRS